MLGNWKQIDWGRFQIPAPVEEFGGQVREVADAGHPHGRPRLGVGAENKVVLLWNEWESSLYPENNGKAPGR